MRVSEWQSKDPNSTSGDTNIWRVDTSSGEVIRLSDGQFDATPVCSPDGKWIYYVQPNGAEPKFQRVSIDGRTSKTVIAMQVLPGIDISRNGKLLSFWSGDEFGVVDIERGKVLRKFSIDPLMYLANGQATYPRFTPDDEALSYARRVDGVDNLWARPLDGKPPYAITFFKSDEINDFHWSPDGQRLGIVRGRTESNVVLLRDTQ